MIHEYEKIEELGIKDYKIIQSKREFCFGSDAVLLARFAKIKKGACVLDICSGTGIIPLLLDGMYEPSEIYSLEIMPSASDMARRSFEMNKLEHKIHAVCGDLKNAADIFGKHRFDAVTVNPPYMPAGKGLVNPKNALAVARHEILCTLDDVLKAAAQVLRPCGKLYMVHRADRLCDVICTFRKYGIEPKRMQTVYPDTKSRATLILLEGLAGGGKQLITEEPIFMYDNDGNYLQSIK